MEDFGISQALNNVENAELRRPIIARVDCGRERVGLLVIIGCMR